MIQSKTVYQVSQLTDEMRRLMEASYPEIWIEGELSSLSAPASGHLYFSLKDERSQLRCAMFKGRASISRYKPKAGDLVRIRAKISVYTARGDLQCIVQHIEEAGEGLLQRRFEELKQELKQQGLFDQKYKKKIPDFPTHIGVITSPSGAAVRDVLTTLERRCPGIPITVYPAVVQGETAAKSLVKALKNASQHRQADVLILTRGGGSLEDLWCFNHDELAKTIFDCPIPIVSGVGHEVDITITDLVADVRAPTPTAAAEMVSPDTEQLMAQLNSLLFKLPNVQKRSIERLGQNVDMLGRRLKHPQQTLLYKRDNLSTTSLRLKRAMQQSLKWQKSSLNSTGRAITPAYAKRLIEAKETNLSGTSKQLLLTEQRRLELLQNRLCALGEQLNLVSPLATLSRGYAIARTKSGNIIRTGKATTPGVKISVQLGEGSLECDVREIKSS